MTAHESRQSPKDIDDANDRERDREWDHARLGMEKRRSVKSVTLKVGDTAKRTSSKRPSRSKPPTCNIRIWLILWSLCLLRISVYQLKRMAYRDTNFDNLITPTQRNSFDINQPSHSTRLSKSSSNSPFLADRLASLSVEIFTAPKPFVGHDRAVSYTHLTLPTIYSV